jgi:hypothetical protein
MSIRKFRPLSPDPYINKTIGDTEFARLAHLNHLVDQVNTEITQVVQSKNYKEYVSKLAQQPNESLLETVIQDDFNTGGITWTNPFPGIFVGTPANDVFDVGSSYLFTIQNAAFSPIILVFGTIQNDPIDTITFFVKDLQDLPVNTGWGTRTFSLKVYNNP